MTIKSTEVLNTIQSCLLLQGGFSNGYFVYTSDTFEINKQGVVSLRGNVTLDRETKDSYILQVQTLFYKLWGSVLPPGFSMFQNTQQFTSSKVPDKTSDIH